MIVIGAIIGAGGLGDYVYNGMSRADSGPDLAGRRPRAALHLRPLLGLGGLERLARRNSTLGMSRRRRSDPCPVRLRGLWHGGAGASSRGGRTSSSAPGISPKARSWRRSSSSRSRPTPACDVEVVSNLPTSVSLKAMKNGDIDLYPEYTGNLLTNKEGLDLPVPADKSTITALVRQEMRRAFRHGRAGRSSASTTPTPRA